MKIAAMGAGGVGGYFGARLQQAGHDVTFFARGRHLEAIRTNGLKVESPHGNACLKVRVLEDPREANVVDVVLFAVKLWDTETAAERLRPVVGPETAIIPFQNGVESIARLRKVFPEKAVLGGSAYIATRVKSPGVIEHTGEMSRLQFGPVLPSQKDKAVAFLAACREAKINAEIPDDIVRANWEKFVFLVAVSSATAVARAPLGVVRSDPDLRWLFEQAMRETWRLGRARGVALADDFVEARVKFADGLHADMKASLAHDLENRGRLEAPWLCGAVARMSEEAGLDAPVNRAVYAALKPYIDGQ
ncbi:MAG TPA: 2-dehydropantoate 2-reductase [Burkholderiales bacterium]|jgi:2-dehydropantoate 2-reductase|nr:2-dehydropantoate 2-reductase [Burkholderiales bacterium]